ncbi:Protein phosphatase 1 regulatory subunit [Lachnellula occidentalis]|uniref:Protein phosphatase 1 regulatory subunit n=1 Tax=Lachnellula occidentalis TaxID=215460 RepID=A0A8H8RUT7_9HELO|nr:Protein phosphatase 1 regulatory subunit [Lachnellula occidentalis]
MSSSEHEETGTTHVSLKEEEHEEPGTTHISLKDEDSPDHHDATKGSTTPKSSSGWDGKLRIEKKAQLVNPEAISDPEYSTKNKRRYHPFPPTQSNPTTNPTPQIDLLDDYPLTTPEIDCVHARISSIPPLRLSRFTALKRLCLRQNTISKIEDLPPTLTELDLYDNLIAHIKNLEHMTALTSLDLSFNKIKHIKNLSALTGLTDLYFVQNKITTIEGLEGLSKLRNLELAANRIREIGGGLRGLQGLEELWLGKNKISEIAGLESLQKLKILSIQSNRIREISGLSALPHLQELYISHNALTSLHGLEECKGLKVLDISNNQISKLEGLEGLEELEEVWASYNMVGDFNEVERVLGGKKGLNTVYFEGNPLQLRGPAVYRNKVKLALPQVMQIDATFVRVS